MSAETNSYTDADVQAGADAILALFVGTERADLVRVREDARAALDAAAPAIAARALREFATHIQFAEWPMPPDIGHVAMEAHARADEIEAGR